MYVALWFDTEDYLDPTADDAALRIANDLTAEGVRGTFKVVGERARVLESRGRRDVIQALSRHDIGYHSNWHSVHPTPSEYLVKLGYLEGAENSSAGKVREWQTSSASLDGSLPATASLAIRGDRKATWHFETGHSCLS